VALLNIESILSIEKQGDNFPCVAITTTGGKTFYMRIDKEAERKYGGQIRAALHEIVDAWYHADKCDYAPLDSPYRDQVVATLIEGETIPVSVQNPGEFHD
jgi:hypothetical protein